MRGEPQVAHHRDIGLHNGLYLLDYPLPAFEFYCLGARLLEKTPCIADSVSDAGLVGEEWHIGNYEGLGLRIGDAFYKKEHHVHGSA